MWNKRRSSEKEIKEWMKIIKQAKKKSQRNKRGKIERKKRMEEERKKEGKIWENGGRRKVDKKNEKERCSEMREVIRKRVNEERERERECLVGEDILSCEEGKKIARKI